MTTMYPSPLSLRIARETRRRRVWRSVRPWLLLAAIVGLLCALGCSGCGRPADAPQDVPRTSPDLAPPTTAPLCTTGAPQCTWTRPDGGPEQPCPVSACYCPQGPGGYCCCMPIAPPPDLSSPDLGAAPPSLSQCGDDADCKAGETCEGGRCKSAPSEVA